VLHNAKRQELAPPGSPGSAPFGARSPQKINAANGRSGIAAFIASIAKINSTIAQLGNAFSASPCFCDTTALLSAVCIYWRISHHAAQ
jgi:hypothetical protein